MPRQVNARDNGALVDAVVVFVIRAANIWFVADTGDFLRRKNLRRGCFLYCAAVTSKVPWSFAVESSPTHTSNVPGSSTRLWRAALQKERSWGATVSCMVLLSPGASAIL